MPRLAIAVALALAATVPVPSAARGRRSGAAGRSRAPVRRHPELRQHVPRRERAVRHGPGQPGHRRSGSATTTSRTRSTASARRTCPASAAAWPASCRSCRPPARSTASTRTPTGPPISTTTRRPSPGYYRVGLDSTAINAELTATARTGWQRYTFPATGAANVLFNTGQANQYVSRTPEIHVVGDRTHRGLGARRRLLRRQRRPHRLLHRDRSTGRSPRSAPGAARPRSGRAATPPAPAATAPGSPSTRPPTADVVLKVGLSYTGVAGRPGQPRRRNRRRLRLRRRAAGAARAVGGATRRDQDRRRHGRARRPRSTPRSTTRCCTRTWPATSTARTPASTARCTTPSDYTPYQNFSLWDTYRPQNQLLEMLRTGRWRGTWRCRCVAIGRDGGWLPRWALAEQRNQHHDRRPGDAVPGRGVVEGPARRARAGGVRAAAAERDSASRRADSPYNGRTGVDYYSDRGYIPSGLSSGTDCVAKGGDNDCQHPASATLEYSAADAALSLMAAGLGKAADARDVRAAAASGTATSGTPRSQQFRPAHGRRARGSTPYDPVTADDQFHEGGAYQYQWLVPQDPAGLVSLMGGTQPTEKRLDAFFAYDKLLTDPAGTARTGLDRQPVRLLRQARPTTRTTSPTCWRRTCTSGPAQPAKTATVVRAAMTLFTTGPGRHDRQRRPRHDVGLVRLLLARPLPDDERRELPRACRARSSRRRPSDGRHGPRGLDASLRPGASDATGTSSACPLDGREPVRQTSLDWASMAHGGTLAHQLGSRPSSWGTSPAAEPPSVNNAPPATRRTPPSGSTLRCGRRPW